MCFLGTYNLFKLNLFFIFFLPKFQNFFTSSSFHLCLVENQYTNPPSRPLSLFLWTMVTLFFTVLLISLIKNAYGEGFSPYLLLLLSFQRLWMTAWNIYLTVTVIFVIFCLTKVSYKNQKHLFKWYIYFLIIYTHNKIYVLAAWFHQK